MAYGADFTNAKIRLDSMKALSSPGNILVTVTVNEADVEDSVQIVAGQAWTISQTASDFTISTANLPSGTTAWPGIGTASQVSGQTITFPSSDLGSGMTYGFFITGGINTNPATGNNENYLWRILTEENDSESSSATISIPIIANDQITITATITPPASSYATEITTSDTTTLIPQETVLEYTITYGSTYVYSSPITLQASWSKGTQSGGSTPTIDVLEYVPNSASQAYGSTAPVIDTVARTITWDIASFPANTSGETVTFQLKTTSSYSGSSVVDFSVSSKITQPVLTTTSSIDHTYQYVSTVTPTPTPVATAVPGSTATPTPATTTTTPTPTPPTLSIQFLSYRVMSLEDTSATLLTILNQDVGIMVRYGTDPNNLDKIISSPVNQSQHSIELLNLIPGETYFVQLEATNLTQKIYSDVLSFTTSLSPSQAIIDQISIFSSGSHLTSFSLTNIQHILSSRGSLLDINVNFKNGTDILSATLTVDNEQGTYLGSLHESQEDLWTGKLVVPHFSQILPVILTIESGLAGTQETIAIQQFTIFFLHPSQELRVLDHTSRLPIERAEVLVYKQKERTRLFEILPAPALIYSNPLFSNGQGNIPLSLSPGTYRFTVKAIGYQSQTIDLMLTDERLQQLPTFSLVRNSFIFFDQISYHFTTIQQRITQLASLLFTEAQSSATFQLVTFFLTTVLTPFTFLSLFARAQFSFKKMGKHFMHDTFLIFRSKLPEKKFLVGKVIEKNSNSPINHAQIAVVDPHTQVTLEQTGTGFRGQFSLGIHNTNQVQVVVTAKGFQEKNLTVDLDSRTTAITIELTSDDQKMTEIKSGARFVISHFLPRLFESLLLVTLVMQILFLFTFRTVQILPFLGLTLFNLSVWLQQEYSQFVHRSHLT